MIIDEHALTTNLVANHGFLPHNGYATIDQFVDVTMNVVGMGRKSERHPLTETMTDIVPFAANLALFLSAYGAVIDGSGLAWSIGGTPTRAQAGLLPGGNGLSGSHNKYEGDASPTRPDLYEEGNNYKTQADQFQALIDASPGGEVTLDSLTAFRSDRFDEQIASNPDFFNGPFTGVLVQPAAYTFIYRFMANHSEENPYGYLSYDVIKDWFGITGEDGSYVANQGQERIPENWYKRAVEYPYETTYFVADAAAAIGLHPKFANVGGNTGTTNSFTGVDVDNLTGGVYNAQSLANGDNFACFAYQFAAQAKPDVALSVITALTDAVGTLLAPLACPELESFDEDLLMQFPGYERSPAAS